jgi:hypothetical protein
MELFKALVLVEKVCYIACLNRIYGNLPLAITTLDCIAAERPLPCSLCMQRSGLTLKFGPSPLPPGYPPLPPFSSVPTTAAGPSTASGTATTSTTTKKKLPKSPAAIAAANEKKLKLTCKERTLAETALGQFGESVYQAERDNGPYPYIPRSSYFPSPMMQKILDELMKITTMEVLTSYTASWMHLPAHGIALLHVITGLRDKFMALRNDARIIRNANAHAAAALK